MLYTQENLDRVDKAEHDFRIFGQPIKFVIDGEVTEYPDHKVEEFLTYRSWFAEMVARYDPTVETISAIQLFGSKGL